jgi:DNA-dependent protein kinase catalytic subunit
MGCLDLPEGPVAIKFLEHVGTYYPSALYYSFKITSEFLGRQGEYLTINLRNLLRNNAVDCFVTALSGLTHPELRWTEGLKALRKIFQTNSSTEESKMVKLSRFYKELCDTCLSNEWDGVQDRIGSYNRHWAKQMKKIADSCVGSNGEKLISVGINALDVLVEKSKPLTKSDSMKFGFGKVKLSEFSEWLSDFDPLQHKIEIPGQFFQSTDRPPSISSHEQILCVDPMVLVMSSIRKPKRIKFYGSSGNEFMFLAKGCEDLRNDERIQQLFLLMNSVVSKGNGDAENAHNMSSFALKARTYAVIPMSSKVGLLEWVSNTAPLKSIIVEEMAKDADFVRMNPSFRDPDPKKYSYKLEKIKGCEMRQNWLPRVKSGDNADDAYHLMFRNKDRESAVTLGQQISQIVPDDFLRRRLLHMSTGPETFITLRSEFSRSLAVSSVYGYILGLGDRHLENLLVDSQSGSIVQIDFGICFGQGASELYVPELIPFRLSPQLRSILRPLDGTGLLRHWMVQCMNKLRAEEGISVIANALEVYINDPVLEWRASPFMKAEEVVELVEASQLQSSQLWEPKRRISNAVKKLEGVHPVKLLLDDLSTNKFVRMKKSYASLQSILLSCCSPSNSSRTEILTSAGDNIIARSSGSCGSSLSAAASLSSEVSFSLPSQKQRLSSKRGAKDSLSNGSEGTLGGGGSLGLAGGVENESLHRLDAVLDSGQQVEALIQLATDPNILMRQWVGLMAWI